MLLRLCLLDEDKFQALEYMSVERGGGEKSLGEFLRHAEM